MTVRVTAECTSDTHTHTHTHAHTHTHSPLNPEEDNTRLLDLNSHLAVQDLLLYRFHTAGVRVNPPPPTPNRVHLAEKSRIRAPCKRQLFSLRPSGPAPAGTERSRHPEKSPVTDDLRAAASLHIYSVNAECCDGGCCLPTARVVNILSSVSRSQRGREGEKKKTPVMQMWLLRKRSGLSSRRWGETEARERERENEGDVLEERS